MILDASATNFMSTSAVICALLHETLWNRNQSGVFATANKARTYEARRQGNEASGRDHRVIPRIRTGRGADEVNCEIGTKLRYRDSGEAGDGGEAIGRTRRQLADRILSMLRSAAMRAIKPRCARMRVIASMTQTYSRLTEGAQALCAV